MSPTRFLSDKYGHDVVDGRKTPQLVITEDFTLTIAHQGQIHVEAGTLVLDGVHEGSMRVHSGATAIIRGMRTGSLLVELEGKAIIIGETRGSSTIDQGGILVIERSGRVTGSIMNLGKVMIRGEHTGSRNGTGQYLVDGGWLKSARDPIDGDPS
jgi:hypothetical protein